MSGQDLEEALKLLAPWRGSSPRVAGPLAEARRRAIVKAAEQGVPVSEIARALGISTQRIYQIIARERRSRRDRI